MCKSIRTEKGLRNALTPLLFCNKLIKQKEEKKLNIFLYILYIYAWQKMKAWTQFSPDTLHTQQIKHYVLGRKRKNDRTFFFNFKYRFRFKMLMSCD